MRLPHASLALATLLAVVLAACGGAAVYVGDNGSGVAFSVNAFLDGRSYGAPIRSGDSATVVIQAGQSIEFDATGSATWRFSLNGGPLVAAGNTLSSGGLVVTVAPVSASRVRVTTTLSGAATLPATLTLSAMSTVDNREIATVQLQVR